VTVLRRQRLDTFRASDAWITRLCIASAVIESANVSQHVRIISSQGPTVPAFIWRTYPQSPCSDLETEREIRREGLNFEQVGTGAKGWPSTTQRAQEPFLLFFPVNFEDDRGQGITGPPALGFEAAVVMSARTERHPV
jgi:hypothetical protein